MSPDSRNPKKFEIRQYLHRPQAETCGKRPKFDIFAIFDHLATQRRAQTPTKTLIDIDSMSCDMLGHSSVHFGGVRGGSEGPRARKNHEFSGFCDFPLCGDPGDDP